MPSGKKRKRHKMATHKRKKRLKKNRHKKKYCHMRGGRAVHKTYALPPYTLYYFLFTLLSLTNPPSEQ